MAVAVADRVAVLRVLAFVSGRDRRVLLERVADRLARDDDVVPVIEVCCRGVNREEPIPLPIVLPLPFPVVRSVGVV